MSDTIPIAVAKAIREKLGATHLVVFMIMPDGAQHVLTQGQTEAHAKVCAAMGNELKKTLEWPAELCADKPIQRICDNCSFYKKPEWLPGYGREAEGKCMWEPVKVPVKPSDKCHHFEPKA